jgi:hypothetical protein
MNSSTVLIVAALCLAIGYIAGLLITSLVGSRSKSESETENPDLDKRLPNLPATPPAGFHIGISKPMPATEQRVPPFDQVLVWRDRPGGGLQIDLDGKSYSKASSLTPGQRQRLSAWIPEIQSWLGITLAKTSVEANKRDADVANGILEAKTGETRLDINSKPVLPQAQKSIVTQIDEILQDQMSGTALAERGIRLCEAPGQGVTVWIGLEQFQGIDAVTDAEVLTAIRHAVNTWEAKAG